MTEIEKLQAELSELKGKLVLMGEALGIYGKAEHWMPITDDAPSDRLIVTKADVYKNGNGWEIAQAALTTTQPDIHRIRDEIRSNERRQYNKEMAELLQWGVLDGAVDGVLPVPEVNRLRRIVIALKHSAGMQEDEKKLRDEIRGEAIEEYLVMLEDDSCDYDQSGGPEIVLMSDVRKSAKSLLPKKEVE